MTTEFTTIGEFKFNSAEILPNITFTCTGCQKELVIIKSYTEIDLIVLKNTTQFNLGCECGVISNYLFKNMI